MNTIVRGTLYKNFIEELAYVNSNAPKGKAPKLLNSHLYRRSPFHKPTKNEEIHNLAIKLRSEKYMASGLDTTTTTTTSSTKENFVQDIPLPRCLVRHITNPSYCLSNATSLGKITGYRIEVTGRRGTRSSKQTVSHGKIDNPDIGASYADFARSWYVHKKGVSGVKVWVGYSK